MDHKYYKHRKSHTILGMLMLAILTILHTSCKKLVEVHGPTTNISGENVFTNDATAAALMTGIYAQMSNSSLIGGELISIGFLTGLSGDELTLFEGANNQDLRNYYLNSLPANAQPSLWNIIYPKIYVVNTIIENAPPSGFLSATLKKQLIGEAKFTRAFFYFYLTNLYGDVPLVTSTDYTINSMLHRTPQDQIWAQIISDLNDAKDLLSLDYVDASLTKNTVERLRPNRFAAIALLSRCYLYTHDWKNAEAQATEVINNTSLYHLDSLSNTFQKNNSEAIWQLQPVNYGSNTEDAKAYILHETGFNESKTVYLSHQLLSAFEANDQRKKLWIDSIFLSGKKYFFASKYKSDSLNAPLTEYTTTLRLGEQLLIRAEARIQQDNIDGGLEDLNLLRKRSWLNNLKLTSKNLLLDALYHERQVELFTEWGNRWFDLKRINRIDNIMSTVTPLKGGKWDSNWQLYPIPPVDILANGNITQNTGY